MKRPGSMVWIDNYEWRCLHYWMNQFVFRSLKANLLIQVEHLKIGKHLDNLIMSPSQRKHGNLNYIATSDSLLLKEV